MPEDLCQSDRGDGNGQEVDDFAAPENRNDQDRNPDLPNRGQGQIRERRLLGTEDFLLEIGDFRMVLAERRTPGNSRIEKAAALAGGAYDDGQTERAGNLAGLTVERAEIAGPEQRGCREALEDEARGRQLPVDPDGQLPGGFPCTLLRPVLFRFDIEPGQDPGKQKDRNEKSARKRQKMDKGGTGVTGLEVP